MEGDHIRRVDERQAQVLGHQARGEILAAAHELLGGVAARAGALGERGELVADGIAEPQLVGDVKVALADVCKQVVARDVVIHVRVDQIQQVGDLGVALGATTARTHHHKATRRVASMIALILRKCSASATDEPPNLVILIMVSETFPHSGREQPKSHMRATYGMQVVTLSCASTSPINRRICFQIKNVL